VFCMIPLYDQAKYRQTASFIGKGPNLIGLCPKLTKQSLQVIGCPNVMMQV
jgi:hypothetical protein